MPPPAPKPEAKTEAKTDAEKAKADDEAKAADEGVDDKKRKEVERDEKTERPGEDSQENDTHPATVKTASDEHRGSVPTIVEPEARQRDSEDTHQGGRQGQTSPTIVDPPPRSPSAVAAEEEQVSSPPNSSGGPPSEDFARKMSGLPSPPPAASSNDKLNADHHNDRHGRRPSMSEPEAQDLLLDAAWDGDLKAAARALRHISHSVCDLRGLTPLHLAAERDHLALAILLLDRGATVHERSDGGRTALHLAARSASSSVVEMLLERGKADPNAATAKGRTALHYAASKAEDGDEERREVLRVLRDWGADPTLEDKVGETARDVAQKREHWDAASTLRRAERKWEEEHRQGWLQRHGFKK